MQPLALPKNGVFRKIPQDSSRSVRGWVPGHHVPKKCPKLLKNNALRFPNMIPTFEKWASCCGYHVAEDRAGVDWGRAASSWFHLTYSSHIRLTLETG